MLFLSVTDSIERLTEVRAERTDRRTAIIRAHQRILHVADLFSAKKVCATVARPTSRAGHRRRQDRLKEVLGSTSSACGTLRSTGPV
jgi:hypothetical protein